MNDPRCDHYWLTRQGGVCRFCGDSFPGQFEPSEFQLKEKEKHLQEQNMQKMFSSFSEQSQKQGFTQAANIFKEAATKKS